jgi:hypothetical protein
VWVSAQFGPPAVDAVRSVRLPGVGWSWWWLLVPVGLAGVVLVRRARSPYRVPRRRFRRY